MASQKLILPMVWLVSPAAFAMDAKEAMVQRGVSSCWIAKTTGLPKSAVWNILEGRRQPRPRDMLTIAAAVGLIKFYDPPTSVKTAKRLWKITKKGWSYLSGAIGLIASLLGIWAFFRG